MKNDNKTFATCGCWILVLIFNLIVGGWSVNYLLDFFLSKTIPFWGAMIIGIIVAEFSIPVAIVIFILRFFGAI